MAVSQSACKVVTHSVSTPVSPMNSRISGRVGVRVRLPAQGCARRVHVHDGDTGVHGQVVGGPGADPPGLRWGWSRVFRRAATPVRSQGWPCWRRSPCVPLETGVQKRLNCHRFPVAGQSSACATGVAGAWGHFAAGSGGDWVLDCDLPRTRRIHGCLLGPCLLRTPRPQLDLVRAER